MMQRTYDRREALKLSGTIGAAALAAPMAAATQAGSRPPDVGRKFAADGQVLPFAGNTVICHLDQQGPNSAPFDTLLDIYREAPAARFYPKVTMLPPSSYHMTIFGGANDPDRRPGLWPADLPLDMPIDESSRILGERLRTLDIGDVAPFRMRVDLSEPATAERPLTIRLLPVDEAENRKLRLLRDRLSQAMRIRAPGHDGYRFHVTMAYLIDWLTGEEDRDYRTRLRRWRTELARRCPVISLGRPEYCTLKDMFAFHRQFHL